MAELHDATSLSAAGLPLPKNWLAIIAFIWAGQAASMITSYAAGYAVVWYVTESTGSALMLAAMNIAVMLPVGAHLALRRHRGRQAQPQAHHDCGRRRCGRYLAGGGRVHFGRRRVHPLAARRVHRARRGPGLPQSGHDGGHAHARARQASVAHQHLGSAAGLGGLHRSAGLRHLLVHHPRLLLGDVPRFRRSLRGHPRPGPGEDSHGGGRDGRRISTYWRTCAMAGAPLRRRAGSCC